MRLRGRCAARAPVPVPRHVVPSANYDWSRITPRYNEVELAHATAPAPTRGPATFDTGSQLVKLEKFAMKGR